MTGKIRERLLNALISIVTSAGAVVLSFALFASNAKSIGINKELDEKAPYDYVNMQDAELEKDLDDYRTEHQKQHTAQYNDLTGKIKSVDGKVQFIYDWVLSQPK